jgi:hypothetical protein
MVSERAGQRRASGRAAPARRPLLLALAALLLTGCAGLDPYRAAPAAQHLQRTDDVGRCARLLQEVDRRIDAAGVRDGQSAPVAGFPYLRADRLTAALAPPPAHDPRFAAWTGLLAQLDQQARRLELTHTDAAPAAVVETCRTVLALADETPAARTLLRGLGLYALARLPFAAGVRQWQRATEAAFATPESDLPLQGELRRYAPAAPAGPLPRLPQAPQLGLPALDDARLRTLIAQHAPLLQIDRATDADDPGALRWVEADGRLRVATDPSQPVAYVRTSYALLQGRAHLQLVYGFWFARRPAAGPLDLLAGALDGLMWRVTLAADGTPLVFDSIHPCGCYHLFFASSRVEPRSPPRRRADGGEEGALDETLFMPQAGRLDVAAGERVLLRLAAGTHYLQRVSVVAADGAGPAALAYALRDDDELRSLPLPAGGRRSAFGPDGLIAGTERAERWLFWPMGIRSAGQMRQWGRHATAFVGRRHFDDPRLLGRYFALTGPP